MQYAVTIEKVSNNKEEGAKYALLLWVRKGIRRKVVKKGLLMQSSMGTDNAGSKLK